MPPNGSGSSASSSLSALPKRFDLRAVWKALASLKLAIVCLALLMVLVVLCTLDQVHLGTYGAVSKYIRSLLVWSEIPGFDRKFPVFPGGGLVGLVLFVNLIAAQFARLERSWRKAGLWVVHFGLILLFLGEFVTGFFQVESQMAIDVGSTKNYAESLRDTELAVTDTSSDAFDEVFSFPQSAVRRGGDLTLARLPVTLRVKRYYPNSSMVPLAPGAEPMATTGPGSRFAVREEPPTSRDDERDSVAAYVEVLADGKSLGTFLVSNAFGMPQHFTADGRQFRIELRQRRYYLPFSLTLKEFRHDVYPGTDIPKNFSSLVRLNDPARGEDRDVKIFMNHPLRYGGKTFYQASFGKNDTMSVLQVVRNPGWLLPYLACVLVGAGLLVHFAVRLL